MSVACEVVDCLPRHLTELGGIMRMGDRDEMSLLGLSPRKAVWDSYRASHYRKTYMVDGKIGAIGGCSGAILSPLGHPWLLTSPAVEMAPISFVKEARKQVLSLLEIHSTLKNYVDARYLKAIGLLGLIGFEVGREEIQVPGGLLLSYEMTRG